MQVNKPIDYIFVVMMMKSISSCRSFQFMLFAVFKHGGGTVWFNLSPSSLLYVHKLPSLRKETTLFVLVTSIPYLTPLYIRLKCKSIILLLFHFFFNELYPCLFLMYLLHFTRRIVFLVYFEPTGLRMSISCYKIFVPFYTPELTGVYLYCVLLVFPWPNPKMMI